MAARFKKVNKQQVEAQERKIPKAVNPASIMQLAPSAYFGYDDNRLRGMAGMQQYAKDLTTDARNYAKDTEDWLQKESAQGWAANQQAKKQAKEEWNKKDILDKGSAQLWNILSGIAELTKQDVANLKQNPVGSLKATLDSYTVGPEARKLFKQGDYAGAINRSGAGSMFALDSLDNIFQGKGSKGDALWLALTYGTGPLGKALKGGKNAVKTGTTKAYTNILNRLP